MKFDLNTKNLDWDKATVRDYRYIHHLMMMVHERWTKLGMSPSGFSGSNGSICVGEKAIGFSLIRYAPGGLLTWDQLVSIYHAMVYLGLYCYINPKNLNEKYWKNGDNRKLICFSVNDMCEIAEFDFHAHPFIPGQPLDYYSQFLYPIKKVLAEYKLIGSNLYLMRDTAGVWQYATTNKNSINPLPTIKKNNTEYAYAGYDKINFMNNKSNWRNGFEEYTEKVLKNGESSTYSGVKNVPQPNPAILGYTYTVNTQYEKVNDYAGPYAGNWRVESGKMIYSVGMHFGNWFKLINPFPAGTPYKIYMYHITPQNQFAYGDVSTTGSGGINFLQFAKYNSPWPMLYEYKSGVVPESCEVMEWIQLPNFSDIPLSTDETPEGEIWHRKIVDEGNGKFTEYSNYGKAYGKMYDTFSAKYYPLFVFDFSSRFEYE
jgi:hypothetical protein